MWLYFLGIAKTSCSSFILPQEAFFFHCLLLLERFTFLKVQGVFLWCGRGDSNLWPLESEL
ncbi:hypothetical protein B5F27_14590 [Faecalibacterium sp. An192]|nr:hypothetical protein B5F27_14590 [Faecalibacterium sp. An192]